ncbi:MAG: inner-rane translocator [Thermoleophilia bacterium]|nr:inner-rane translocator [Thermoleophilia bacterium]
MELLADVGPWGAIMTVAGIYALFAIGLQVQVGHGGVDNFGQVGFFAIGAYASTILMEDHGWGIVTGTIGAMVIAMFAAVIVSIPTLRLRGDFLAITAIAFSEILRNVAVNARELTGGTSGIDAFKFRVDVVREMRSNLRADDIEIDRLVPLLVLTWLLVLAVAILTSLLLRTPWGRVLRAVREDDTAVRALGKNAFLYKAQAMAIGAAWGALAGVLYAWNQVHFSPASFEPIVTFSGFVILIVAGIGSIWGTVLMAILVQGVLIEGSRYVDTPFNNAQEASVRYMIIGLLLMLVVAFRPQGVFGSRAELAATDE